MKVARFIRLGPWLFAWHPIAVWSWRPQTYRSPYCWGVVWLGIEISRGQA